MGNYMQILTALILLIAGSQGSHGDGHVGGSRITVVRRGRGTAVSGGRRIAAAAGGQGENEGKRQQETEKLLHGSTSFKFGKTQMAGMPASYKLSIAGPLLVKQSVSCASFYRYCFLCAFTEFF